MAKDGATIARNRRWLEARDPATLEGWEFQRQLEQERQLAVELAAFPAVWEADQALKAAAYAAAKEFIATALLDEAEAHAKGER